VFLSYADEGSKFVYGYLVSGQPFNTQGYNTTGNISNSSDVRETAFEVAAFYNANGVINGKPNKVILG
jgi:hypothetical protein